MNKWENKDYKCISTLTTDVYNIFYYFEDSTYYVKWGEKTEFEFTQSEVNNMLNNFFVSENQWYPLGASETSPMPDGFGKYLDDNYEKLSPRHASAISAILVDRDILVSRGMRPVELKKQ